MPDDAERRGTPSGGASRRRTPERDRRKPASTEPPRTAPTVTMSGAELDRLRDRLRRKFH